MRCKSCGEDSGEYELCKKCYSKNIEINQKKNSYPENIIKGRIAESLIEELFLAMDYDVFRYGMENTIPGITKLLSQVRGDVAHEIRRMPDFVVRNRKTNEVFFIEVKFRADGQFDSKDNSIKNYPYMNAFFVVVSKKHIKCISYKEILEGESIESGDRKYLGNRKEFELDKEIIIKFCEFAVKFFESV